MLKNTMLKNGVLSKTHKALVELAGVVFQFDALTLCDLYLAREIEMRREVVEFENIYTQDKRKI